MVTAIDIVLILFALLSLAAVMLVALSFPSWAKAQAAGIHVPVAELMKIVVMRTPPTLIVDAIILLKEQGFEVTATELAKRFGVNRPTIRSAEDLAADYAQNKK